MKNEVGRVSSTMLSSDESVESSFHLGGGVMSGQVKDYFFKLLVIGDVCVGKTSFVDRYVYNKEFDSTYKTTIGVDFAIKSLKWSETERIRLQVQQIIIYRLDTIVNSIILSCGICQVSKHRTSKSVIIIFM